MSESTPYDADPTDAEERSDAASAQLPREDTLVQRGVDDLLDEGYSPPDFPRSGLYDETPLDEALGETIDRELAEEEPEAWDTDDEGSATRDELFDDAPDPRSGRLEADADALDGRGNDLFADDEGVAGGAASAEEAAVHVVSDREQERSEEILDDITDASDDGSDDLP